MSAEPDWLRVARERGLIESEGKPATLPGVKPVARPKSSPALVGLRWGLVAELPLAVTGEGLNGREHWAARHQRSKRERAEAAALLESVFGRGFLDAPGLVRLVLIGGLRRIDGDNLQGRLKAVRDGVADWLGIDDGDSRVMWEYAHEQGREAGVRVELRAF